ncbi:hypothetical protein V6N13_113882 [Hibiscus sabdariffa]|uniref:XS domain-containing protein n=1 Tax=Hibiscus sabdariffa TaxID=183260 RepID=A0ABR2U047_9ROSI
MSSKKLDSRYPNPRSRHQEKQLQYRKSSHGDNDSELCFKKLSEFNESLKHQQLLTSTKFQWNHLLSDNLEKAAAASSKPEPTMLNDRKTPSYSMGPMGIDLTGENRLVDSRPLHMKEGKPGFFDIRFPDVGNEVMVGETVGFGERLDFDPSSVILEKAMNRFRRTEEVLESSYWKLESERATASAMDSIVDKVDGSGETTVLELDRQQYMSGKKMEVLYGGRHLHKEDCSRHALTQRYVDFSGGERGLGRGMNLCCNPNGALFHRGKQRSPQLYPDVNGKPHGKQSEQESEVLGRPFHGAQSQNGELSLGESLQIQHSAPFSRKLHDGMTQDNEDFHSWMICHQSPKSVPSHGEKQELSEDNGHTLPQTYVDFGSETHAMEKANDVSSSRMNRPQGQKLVLSEGEKLELATDYVRSLPQRHLDFNVELNDKQPENGFLGSGMNHQPKQNETPSQGETKEMQQDFSLSLPHRHFCLSGESQVMKQETEVLGSRMCYPRDHNDAYFAGEIQQLRQDRALGIKPLPKADDDVRTNEGSNQHISSTEEVGINNQSPVQHPKKRIIDLRKIRETRISKLTQTSDVLDGEILDIYYGDEGSSENSGLQRNITDSDYQFSSPHIQDFAHPTSRKSIKQRLGRSCRVNHPYPPHGKSIKERLGLPSKAHDNRTIKPHPGPPCQIRDPTVMPGIGRHITRKPVKENVNDAHSPIAMPRIERHKMSKRGRTEPLEENINEFHKGVQAQDVSHIVKRGRTEPPDDSDEFKQSIHAAYVKFVKVLNENPAQRRKYTNQGEVKTLKCCVCGSKSEDFVSTLSLAMHAFTSQNSWRRRVEHMGLHRALCLLMGWDSMAVSDGLWAPKALPDTEALAMKEDLVVWPPVVILHNSSIGTAVSDDRIIVSLEELEAFLRDTGFGQGISKVCRGKPANQSIMVVIFHGTFSGLRDAERLHNLYVENKHGRDEFLRVNYGGGETQKGSLNKVKDVLYGYLGIAGDLDKLDFETKSHSVIKSKKEIYGIADARANEKLGMQSK